MNSEDTNSTQVRTLREDLTDQLRRYGMSEIPPVKVTSYDARTKLDGLTVALQQRFVPLNKRVLSVHATCPDCWLDVTSLDILSQEDFQDAFARPLSTHICKGQARREPSDQ